MANGRAHHHARASATRSSSAGARGRRPYGMTGTFEPLIPRERALEVDERMNVAWRGGDAARRGAGARPRSARLAAMGCESLVIHFLHAYANPAHELRAGEIARALWPNDYVTLGHALLSEFREYERGTTASVNAAVQPILDRYVRRLQGELEAPGLQARPAGHERQRRHGVGAARGARGGQDHHVGPGLGRDGGGGDAGAVGHRQRHHLRHGRHLDRRGADPRRRAAGVLRAHHRLRPADPCADGGRARASAPAAARSPRSMRRACCRSGRSRRAPSRGPSATAAAATEPTITDANLVLGRLDPERPAGGVAAGDGGRRCATSSRRSWPGRSGLSVDEAAAAVIRLGNTHMAGAIRMVSLSRGHDPRDFTLFAFGGAGPLHAVALARELGVAGGAGAGAAGAHQCAGLPRRRPAPGLRQHAQRRRSMPPTWARCTPPSRRSASAASPSTPRSRARSSRRIVLHGADMQFRGQTHLIRVAFPRADVSREEMQALFEAAYFARFQVRLPEIRAVLVNLVTSVIGRRRAFPDRLADRRRPRARARSQDAVIGERQLFARRALAVGAGARPREAADRRAHQRARHRAADRRHHRDRAGRGRHGRSRSATCASPSEGPA